MKKRLQIMFCMLVVAVGLCLVDRKICSGKVEQILSEELHIAEKEKTIIILDAGHGGDDPGKIGINQAKEKEINLSIVKRLEELLTEQGYQCVLTRDSDEGLYDPDLPNHKVQDMQNRCKKIDGSKAQLAVSIHQNSYTTPEVRGAQVFYHTQSEQGKILAQDIQEALDAMLRPEHPRAIKGNESYYLLKKTKIPIVIVECGFLSNPEEAKELITEEYQNTLAEAICKGIVNYRTEK